MKAVTLDLGGGMTASCHRGGPTGRYFVGYRKGTSALFPDAQQLRRFLALPPGTPSRQSFDAWAEALDSPPATEPPANESPD
jgi:hypothetical protein